MLLQLWRAKAHQAASLRVSFLPPCSCCRTIPCVLRTTNLQVRELARQATNVFGSADTLRKAVDDAFAGAAYTDACRLTHCLMLLLVERACQLQPTKEPTLAMLLRGRGSQQPGDSSKNREEATPPLEDLGTHNNRIKKLQQQLLQQACSAGKATVRQFDQHKQRLLAAAAGSPDEQAAVASMSNQGLIAVQELLEKLPETEKQLKQFLKPN